MHPKNTTAPPGAQHVPSADELDVLFTHTYYVVAITAEPEVLRYCLPILRDEASAEELASMLRRSFPEQCVKVTWVAAHPNEDIDQNRIVAARMADMVASVRTAADPGHELMSRLGYHGEYGGLAPQKADAPIRGAGGAA